jgi:catechol 2,3-dioxygenase-like lactoylglutathione lyase family enzyme
VHDVRTSGLATTTGVHHIGMTVADLDEALAFWEPFLDQKAHGKGVIDRPYLGEIIGIPRLKVRAAFLDLPGGIVLELVDYHETLARRANGEATCNPGNVHLCLAVDDIDLAWKRAVACGARPVNPSGAVAVDDGPFPGARVAFLRLHDVHTLELFQRPPAN